MPTITEKQLKHHKQYIASLEKEREAWRSLWRELADNYMPQRYRWLMLEKEYTARRARRQYIINNTGTQSARTLAAGMMNGITSPSRPWFKLRVPGMQMDQHRELAVWLEEVERRMLAVMAESNFYNSMAVMYLDMAVFGTAANLIYEDFDNVITCYNPPLGEYYLANDEYMRVGIFARKFNLKVYQVIKRWPDEKYWSERIKNAVKQGGSNLNMDIEICHFIAPNHEGLVPKRFKFYELYWESRREVGENPVVLSKSGYTEKPGVFARWETSGTDSYGVSPGMDALGDVIELQHLHRNKAEMLEKIHRPPVMVDVALQNNPVAMMPGGQTYVANLNNNQGAKPVFTINPNFNELNIDKQGIEERIRNTFYNFLFTGITNLPTVRSAAEIESREGEKLILLGGVLERFESEALDPAIQRIFGIMERARLLPELPQQYSDVPLEIQYVSILSVAQRAVGTAPTERWLGLNGNLAQIKPEVLDLTNFDSLLLNYARDIGIRESDLKDMKMVMQERSARAQQQQAQSAVETAPVLAQAGKTLSETEVGAGGNALEALLGG
jgi:hypothetical protein